MMMVKDLSEPDDDDDNVQLVLRKRKENSYKQVINVKFEMFI